MREIKKAGSRREQSAGMRELFGRLYQLKRSVAWLARSLDPPVSRQAVMTWPDVPLYYIEQVSELLEVEPARVRPDVARIFGVEAAA
jgi:hypothetical protein